MTCRCCFDCGQRPLTWRRYTHGLVLIWEKLFVFDNQAPGTASRVLAGVFDVDMYRKKDEKSDGVKTHHLRRDQGKDWNGALSFTSDMVLQFRHRYDANRELCRRKEGDVISAHCFSAVKVSAAGSSASCGVGFAGHGYGSLKPMRSSHSSFRLRYSQSWSSAAWRQACSRAQER